MDIAIKELLNLKGKKIVEFNLDEEIINDNPYLRKLKNIKANIEIYYDVMNNLMAKLNAEGDMICPCAISLEDVIVPFKIDEEIKLSFNDEEDAYLIADIFDIKVFVLTFILTEVPIKVVKNGKIEYPRGDGWRVMTEDDFKKEKDNRIDPRLAKLKEYKFDEED